MSQLLEHSPADVLRYALVAAGLGVMPNTTGSWPVSVGTEPNKPDLVITCKDTHGRVGGHYGTGDRDEFYGVQLVLRANDKPSLWVKLNQLANAFDTDRAHFYRVTVTLGAKTYLLENVTRRDNGIPMGPERESARETAVLNVWLTITPTN